MVFCVKHCHRERFEYSWATPPACKILELQLWWLEELTKHGSQYDVGAVTQTSLFSSKDNHAWHQHCWWGCQCMAPSLKMRSQNRLTDVSETTADPAAGTPNCCFHGLYEPSQQPFFLSLSCDKPWPDRNWWTSFRREACHLNRLYTNCGHIPYISSSLYINQTGLNWFSKLPEQLETQSTLV